MANRRQKVIKRIRLSVKFKTLNPKRMDLKYATNAQDISISDNGVLGFEISENKMN